MKTEIYEVDPFTSRKDKLIHKNEKNVKRTHPEHIRNTGLL